MSFLHSIRRESGPTLALSIPLVAGHLSHMLTMLADTVMIGQVGATPLAASTLANTLLHLPLVFGIGMATAVSIQVSQARGAEDSAMARSALRHGMFLAGVVGLLSLLGAVLVLPVLPMLKQSPEVVETMPVYFFLVTLSVLPAVCGMMVKSHADSMNRPWTPLWIMLGGVGVNVLLNWLLIFGKMGFPEWGLEGAGVATLIARIVTLIGLIAWCRSDKRLRDWIPTHWLKKPDWIELRILWSLGLPTSMQIVAEMSALICATLIIGSLGPMALAAHQVAITCAATVFVIHLGISQAMTVRIGENFGAHRLEPMRAILVGGWIIGFIITIFSASAFVTLNQVIAQWFLPDSPAAPVAASLLLVAAFFQLADAMQIISVGALRGLGDVRYPAWLSFFACWGISLPIGWILAYPFGLGVKGVWLGFTLSLTVMALAYGTRAWNKTLPAPIASH